MRKILAFAGSTRKDSYNKQILAIAAEGAKQAGADVTLIDLKDYPLPLFDEDLEKSSPTPKSLKQLKTLFQKSDSLLLATPEYNSSISPLMKNTIDWLSRQTEKDELPYSCFKNKFVALISASPGKLGGIRSLYTLRDILQNIKCTVLPEYLCVSEAHLGIKNEKALKEIGKALAKK